MILDIEFIIYGCLIIIALLPLYIYTKKLLSSSSSFSGDFDSFIKDVKVHMENFHPKIKIDYSIVEKTKNEPNLKFRETFIVESVIEQFFNYEYSKTTQKSVSKDKVWANYDEKSVSSPKLPSDWQQRKELAWRRDNMNCNRCGCHLVSLNNVYTTFVKDIKNGGSYTLENIIVLCVDCNKIVNSTNDKNTIDSLVLTDKLFSLIKVQ